MAIPTIKLAALFNIIAAFYWTVDSGSVPLDFCLAPLNISDCGLPPKPVYSYFGTGFDGPICKVTLWRGCSSDNMFYNEKQCVRLCSKEVEDDMNNYRCNIPLNTHACNETSQRVFTFINENKTCADAVWHGCPTLNKFVDKQLCENICLNSTLDMNDKLKIHTKQTEKELQFLTEVMDEKFNRADD